MKFTTPLATSLALAVLCFACGGGEDDAAPTPASTGETQEEPHEHAAGEEDHDHPAGEEEHEHAEDPLGTVRIGDLDVELAQGHGGVEAGKEGHLVVKLPYSDSGATVVRAWIGTEDRTLSYVGKGEYAASHDDYDVHATAPDPLPDGAQWWIEIERPDGTKLVGSAEPLFE